LAEVQQDWPLPLPHEKKGFEVTVADGAKPPIDKACGEGLMPNTVAALRELGIAISFRATGGSFALRFVDGKSRKLRRTFLERAGLALPGPSCTRKWWSEPRSVECPLLWNTPVSGLTDEGAILDGREMRAKWVIGADGIPLESEALDRPGSRIAAEDTIRAETALSNSVMDGLRRDLLGRMMQAYVTPLGDEETCVALISDDPRMRLGDAWEEFPELAARVQNAELSGADRGGVTVDKQIEPRVPRKKSFDGRRVGKRRCDHRGRALLELSPGHRACR